MFRLRTRTPRTTRIPTTLLLASFVLVVRTGWGNTVTPMEVRGDIFIENGDLDIFQDERCVTGVGWEDDDTRDGDDTLIRMFVSGNDTDRTCFADDVLAGTCILPPAAGGLYGTPYTLPLCELPGEQFELRGSAWLDDFGAPCGNDWPPGYDRFIFPPTLSEEVPTPCDGCTLVDQDISSCAGAIVIDFIQSAPGGSGGPPTVPCPGAAGEYPLDGYVLAWLPGDDGFDAATTVNEDRQARFPAPVCSDCYVDLDPEDDDDVCSIPIECLIHDEDPSDICDFSHMWSGGSFTWDWDGDGVADAPVHCQDATVAQYERVVINVNRGGDQRFGRTLTNVPVACGVETRIRFEMAYPSNNHPKLAGAFQVVGYEDELVLCPDVEIGSEVVTPGTPNIVLDDGPSGNTFRRAVEDADPDNSRTTASGHLITPHPFLIEGLARSHLPSVANDKGYNIWGSFALDSPIDLDVWTVSTSHPKGFDEAPFESTGRVLFSDCAVEFDETIDWEAPGAPSDVFIFEPDAQGDWLRFMVPDAVYTLARCPNLATDGCEDVVVPPGDEPCSLLATDPFVMAPGEIQGCLVLDDGDLNVTDALVYEFSGHDFAACGNPAGYAAGFGANSRAETFGIRFDVPGTDSSCADATADWEVTGFQRRRAEILSRLVLAGSDNDETATPRTGSCNPGGGMALRYRVVPGPVGNLANSFQTNRFRLNFEDADAPCPIDGALRINPQAGQGTGDLRQVPIQSLPGTPEAIDEDLVVPFGQLVLFMTSTMPFREPEEPWEDDLLRPLLTGVTTAESPTQVVFTGRWPHLDTGFRGQVTADDNRVARIVAPLPAGTYDLVPEAAFEESTVLTRFPGFDDPIQIVEGEITYACLDEAAGPTVGILPAEYPGGTELGPDCTVPVDVPLTLWECEQASEAMSSFTLTVSVDGETDCDGCGETVVTEPLSCGPILHTLQLHLGPGDECNDDKQMQRTVTVEVEGAFGAPVVLDTDVTLQDTTAPEFTSTPPSEVTFACGEELPAGETLLANDPCADPNPVEVEPVDDESVDGCGLQYVERKWTATDQCGNEAMVSQTLREVDTTPPVLSIVSHLVTTCPIIPPAEESYSVEDDCDASPEVTWDLQLVDTGCPWRYERTFKATDCSDNVSEVHVQVIEMHDTEAPVFDPATPHEITLECGTPIPVPEVSECGPKPTIDYFDSPGPSSCPGSETIYRYWRATDWCGNFSIFPQTINIEDTTPPVFVDPPGDYSLWGTCVLPSSELIVVDECDEDVDLDLVQEVIPGNCLPPMGAGAVPVQVIRTWTATDDCGNSATTSHSIFFFDTNAPMITIDDPGPIPLACGESLPSVEDSGVTVSDPCDPEPLLSFTDAEAPIDCSAFETQVTRTWTVTDWCGNTTTATQVFERRRCCRSWDFEGLAPEMVVLDGDIDGLSITGVGGTNEIVAFDTGAPTCGDLDLTTPGGHPTNTVARGIVLIIQEDPGCYADDYDGPGSMVIDFDDPTPVGYIGLLDVDDVPDGEVAGRVIATLDCAMAPCDPIEFVALGDGSWQAVPIDLANVVRLEIQLAGGAALTDIVCDEADFPDGPCTGGP